MSFTGLKTKKVTTYGKKRTQVIAVHTDLGASPSPGRNRPATPPTPRRPALLAKPSDPNVHRNLQPSSDDTGKKPLAKPVRPPGKPAPAPAGKAAARPAARSKLAQVVVLDADTESEAESTGSEYEPEPAPARAARSKPKAPAAPAARPRLSASSADSPVFARRAPRPGRAVIPRSPTSSPSSIQLAARRSSGATSTVAAGAADAGLAEPAGRARSCKTVEVVIPRRRTAARATSTTSMTTDPLPAVTCDLSSLTLADGHAALAPLIAHTTDAHVHPLSAFASLLAPLAGSDPAVRKLGEASYSEVFLLSGSTRDVVVKVVPLLCAASVRAGKAGDVPDCSDVEDVVRELRITKHMAAVEGGGFVEFLGAYVVEGAYPDVLLDEWDTYKSTLGSASSRPHTFLPDQQYALIALADGGPDLESFEFDAVDGWTQAAGVFWGVADALARAEAWARFEHRDLHEGQVLVRTCAPRAGDAIARSGVQTTMIDFGLSRLDLGGGAEGAPLPADVYDGVGEQWDVYRAMRARVADWAGYHPITNLLWLHYLARRLLLRTPALVRPRRGRPPTTAAGRARVERRAAQDGARGSVVLAEAWLAAALATGGAGGEGGEGGGSGQAGCAGDVVAWARENGWLDPAV